MLVNEIPVLIEYGSFLINLITHPVAHHPLTISAEAKGGAPLAGSVGKLRAALSDALKQVYPETHSILVKSDPYSFIVIGRKLIRPEVYSLLEALKQLRRATLCDPIDRWHCFTAWQ